MLSEPADVEDFAFSRKRERKPRGKRKHVTPRRPQPTKAGRKDFVGWDGEGVTVKGVHRYVLLVNSLGNSIVNPKGLPTFQCLRLMLTTAERNPQAVHVIFGGSYDANMVLHPMLTPAQARRLSTIGRITLFDFEHGKRYKITYHPRHEFGVREEIWNPERGCLEVQRKVTLWDIIGSFQSTFVEACKTRLPPEDLAEMKRIEKFKGKRSTFTLSEIPLMLEYCRAEVAALVRLATIDAEDTEAAGIVGQSRWDGAGAKAAVLLRTHGIKHHKAPTPDEIIFAVRCAYAGGRIEEYRFGEHYGPVWTVDLRSAYPWAATQLPSLTGGTWRQWQGEPIQATDFSLFHIRYSAEHVNDLHPFHWRSPRGNVGYPAATEGWHWAPEVVAAQTWAEGDLEIVEGWLFEPATDERPFDFVPQAFHARQILDRQSRGRGTPLKLALNAFYGKLAQQLGGGYGRLPAYHQLEWAGWITSRCRAVVYTLAKTRLNSLVTIETDGISFMGTPSREIVASEGDDLGNFEVGRYDAGTWVQSGIYWLRLDSKWRSPKVRGVGRNPDGTEVLRREDFTDAWAKGKFEATVPVDVTRFHGMAIATVSARQWPNWCQWVTERREIAVSPSGKRLHDPSCRGCRDGQGLHETLPVGGGSFSSPHKLAWENEGIERVKMPWWASEQEEDDDDVE